jgi:hypothetical protein
VAAKFRFFVFMFIGRARFWASTFTSIGWPVQVVEMNATAVAVG